MIIIDLGACIGYFIKKYCEKLDNIIYAFEPLEKNYNFLKQNYNLDNVKLYNYAVAGFEGKANLYQKKEIGFGEKASSIYKDKKNVCEDKYTTVPCIKLSKFLDSRNIRFIDILKVDTEGTEYDIFEDLLENNMINRINTIIYEGHENKVPSIFEKSRIIENRLHNEYNGKLIKLDK